MPMRLMDGSEAIVEAAIMAGLRFYAGYPMSPATELLEALLIRTIFAEADAAGAPRLASYVVEQRAHLETQDLERLLAGEVDWRPV